MKKIASVDIGTNSVLYSVFNISGKQGLTEIHFERHSPRIGAGLKTQKKPRISDENYDSLKKLLQKLIRHAEKNGAESILIAATNPLRLAVNGREVKENLQWDLGVPVEIVSPEQEAYLSFIGAVGKLRDNQRAMVIDLGGGSTEFVVYKGSKQLAFDSLPEGAVSLTDQFDSSLKADKADFQEYAMYLKRYDARIRKMRKYTDSIIVLVGGTSSALAWLLDETFLGRPAGTKLSNRDLTMLVHVLAGMNLTCRRQLLTPDKKRAEIIFAGAFWLSHVFNTLGITTALASPRGLRHGMVLDFLSE